MFHRHRHSVLLLLIAGLVVPARRSGAQDSAGAAYAAPKGAYDVDV
jgi:hypothetical protein